MKLTDCQCTEEGWCQRHQCLKSRGMFLLCQRSVAAFEQWERGEGFEQNDKNPKLEFLRTPCVHRSAEPIDHIPCELCGARNKRVPVFACEEHGECTQFPTGGRDERAESMASCSRCDSYVAMRTSRHATVRAEHNT